MFNEEARNFLEVNPIKTQNFWSYLLSRELNYNKYYKENYHRGMNTKHKLILNLRITSLKC